MLSGNSDKLPPRCQGKFHSSINFNSLSNAKQKSNYANWAALKTTADSGDSNQHHDQIAFTEKMEVTNRTNKLNWLQPYHSNSQLVTMFTA